MQLTPSLRASAAFAALFMSLFTVAQRTPEEALIEYQQQLQEIDARADSVRGLIEDAKLTQVLKNLRAVGYLTDDAIEHRGMVLAYSEPHEQAKWVMHMITPDIITGQVSRSNDFREDPKVATGTAVEADYFLKYKQEDGSFEYDGFGYDRGHLAPSADFRWSQTALSESYFYSNMSPQVAEFNRESWAELEDVIRGYIYRNREQSLYVVTMPVLTEDLPVIQRSINKVAIPEYYVKVVLDLEQKRGIAFKMPNRKVEESLHSFAMSIDQAEEETGYDFFPLIPEGAAKAAEAAFVLDHWFSEEMLGDAEPLPAPELPRGHFNTTQAKQYMGYSKDVIICGTVVGTRTSRSGNVWLNLDQQYPNQVFSVYIKKEHLINFSYDPEETLKGQVVCIKGRVLDFGGTPTMRIERDKVVEIYE